MRHRSAFLAVAAFVVLGLPDGMLGPAWPTLRHDLHQPLAALGELTALVSAGLVVSSLLGARIRGRLGPGNAIAAGTAGAVVALVLYAASPLWAGLLAASFLIGFCNGQLDFGLNAHVALHHGARLMNALHASYGIGATLGPLAVAAAVSAGSWRWAYAAAAAVDAIVVVALFGIRGEFPADPPERWQELEPTQTRRLALPLMLALFFLLVGLEVAVGAWSPTLLEHRGYGHSAASAWVTSYWALFTVGRAALSFAGRRVAPATTVRASTALTLLGVVLLQWTPVGLPLTGLGLAGLFPALVLLTPHRLGADRAATAIGYQYAAATFGSTCLVAGAGLAAQFVGIGAIVPFLVAAAVALVALELASARYG
jgi:fucose permease